MAKEELLEKLDLTKVPTINNLKSEDYLLAIKEGKLTSATLESTSTLKYHGVVKKEDKKSWNDLIENGVYLVWPKWIVDSPENMLKDSYGILIVLNKGGFISQEFQLYDANLVYLRKFWHNSWNSWRMI